MRPSALSAALMLFVTPVFARAVKNPTTTIASPPPWYTLSPAEASMEDIKDLDALFPDDQRPIHTTVLMALTKETPGLVAGAVANRKDTEGDIKRAELR
ncbi:hypothetical protein B7463_g4039, partial [Scytalidium lignicola]